MTAAEAATHDRPRRARLDIPQIRLLSWLGAESVLWGVVISHLAKWAGNFAYFTTWQVRYSVGYAQSTYTVWYLKDWWDRLPVHIQNGLPGIVAVAVGLTAAVAVFVLIRLILVKWADAGGGKASAAAGITAALAGAVAGLAVARQLAGWHVHWFASQAEPEWWVTDRHDIRDVGISLAATIAVVLLFTKPKYPADDQVPVRVYLTSLPMAIGAALIPIAAIAILAWKVPWLLQHGWSVPARYGALASEVNGFIAKGTWITIAMGVAGGLAAKPFIRRVADDVQWFFAERSAGKVRSVAGLNALRGSRVYGTPAHRKRVRWLLDRRPDLPDRSPWLVRGLLAAGFMVVAFSAAGAWLTLFGPAAVH